METVPVQAVLDGDRGSLTLHRRLLQGPRGPLVLDHVRCSRAGNHLIQERESIQAADEVRHAAEALESLITRPVEPVLVLTSGTPAAPTHRGVQVVAQADLADWLMEQPEVTTRAEMVLSNARVEKATGDWTRHRRIPDWEIAARLRQDGILTAAPAAARRPQGTPGPRAWSPADPSTPPAGNRGGRPRMAVPLSWVVAGMVAMALLLALLGH